MIAHPIQETLRRKLQGVKASFDREDVRDYVSEVIEPHLRSVHINRLSLLLRSRTGQVIVAELASGYLGDETTYISLIEALSVLRCSYFILHTDDGIISGYSENEWDWIVLKYEHAAHAFMEPLVEAFWAPFFDFA